MKKKMRRCLDCGRVISKWDAECHYNRCADCDYNVMINLRTGKIWCVVNAIGNPVQLINGKEKMLKPAIYLVTTKYSNTFYLISDNPESFKINEMFEPVYDFSVPVLEKAFKIFKEFKKERKKLPKRVDLNERGGERKNEKKRICLY
jgi:hypothetical protein